MDWGMENRLARIIQPDTGRTLMLAIDHGYFLGPTSGLETPGKTIAPMATMPLKIQNHHVFGVSAGTIPTSRYAPTAPIAAVMIGAIPHRLTILATVQTEAATRPKKKAHSSEG